MCENREDRKHKLEPEALYHFKLDGVPVSSERYGCGHINETFLVVTDKKKRYILQKINDYIFDVPKLMENIEAVLTFAKEHTSDPRGCMTLVPDENGSCCFHDETGYYRVYDFVEGTVCLQAPENAEEFYESAVGFGSFQQLMEKFPAEKLHETIVNFHNTIDRYRQFHEAIAADPLGRAAEVQKEIAFALEREEEAGILQKLREAGELPVRVTHNDTKLNNVLLDEKTHKALCIIDLDTVMPGLSLYDYGDSIRFGVATVAEDEQDFKKMTINMELFRAYTRGFLESCPGLTDKEIELLPVGAKIMTLECGIRFLGDYIMGDVYFSSRRNGQNRDRARTQLELVAEMERNWDDMNRIVAEEKHKVQKNR